MTEDDHSDQPDGGDAGSRGGDDPALVEADRILSLVDQVIGLQAELAAVRYIHDREIHRLRTLADEASHQAGEATAQFHRIVESPYWRLGRAVIKPMRSIRKSIQRRR